MVRSGGKKNKSGVSLVELMASVAVMSAAMVLVGASFRLIHDAQKEWQTLLVHREAQRTIYEMMREIRNSQYIIAVSSYSFTLSAFDVKNLGYDTAVLWNSDFYNPNNIGTITYKYDVHHPKQISRIATFPYPTPTTTTTTLLKDILVMPDVVNSTYTLFEPFPPTIDTNPLGIHIQLHIGNGLLADAPHTYDTYAMSRSEPKAN